MARNVLGRGSAAALTLVLAVALTACTNSTPSTPTSGTTPPPATATPAPDTPHVSFIGDSWTRGEGAENLYGYAARSADQLEYQRTILGVGGSGYVRGGTADSTFNQRVEAALAAEPDVLVIQGSINDRTTPTPELWNAVRGVLEQVKEKRAARTEVLVLGASHVPGLPEETVDRINEILSRTATEHGFKYVDVAGENWTDPNVPDIWADPYHPNSAGHQKIADHLEPLLRAAAAK